MSAIDMLLETAVFSEGEITDLADKHALLGVVALTQMLAETHWRLVRLHAQRADDRGVTVGMTLLHVRADVADGAD